MIKLDIPTIQPEEMVAGYAGRVMVRNGMEMLDFAEVSRRVLTTAGARVPDFEARRIFEFAATVLQEDHLCVARLHTNLLFESSVVQTIPRSFSTLVARRDSPVRFCKECLEEDLGFWGFSYWRRGHQLPGIDRCGKHNSKLEEVIAGSNALPPMELLPAKSCRSRYQVCNRGISNAVDNYTKVAEALSQLESGIAKVCLSERLAERASVRGVGRTPCGRVAYRANGLLSDFVARQFPAPWLDRHFGWRKKKRDGAVFSEIDGTILRSVLSPMPEHYILVAVALCENVSDSVRLFDSAIPEVSEVSQDNETV